MAVCIINIFHYSHPMAGLLWYVVLFNWLIIATHTSTVCRLLSSCLSLSLFKLLSFFSWINLSLLNPWYPACTWDIQPYARGIIDIRTGFSQVHTHTHTYTLTQTNKTSIIKAAFERAFLLWSSTAVIDQENCTHIHTLTQTHTHTHTYWQCKVIWLYVELNIKPISSNHCSVYVSVCRSVAKYQTH